MTEPLLQPFAALRPLPEAAAEVAARPYDVVSFAEAKAGVAGKPWSFLHVSRAEVDLPEERIRIPRKSTRRPRRRSRR